MNSYIQYSPTKLIKFLTILALSCIFIACDDKLNYKNYPNVHILLPTGETISTYLAVKDAEQKQGLSNIPAKIFKNNEAMLFTGKRNRWRQFWMPETFFDLDIVFLSKDLYVLDIHRALKHFPHKGPRNKIPLSKRVYCQHVLEIKASSPLAKKIHPGMILKLKDEMNLEQIISNIHQQQ